MSATAPPVADELHALGIHPEGVQFSTRNVPWAKLGVVIDAPIDTETALRMAGLGFRVIEEDVATRRRDDGAPIPEDVLQRIVDGEIISLDDIRREARTALENPWRPVENRKGITREDTGERYDIASNDYELVQYVEAFAFMDEVAPHIVAAGPLLGGRQAFIVAQRPDLTFLDLDLGDQHDPHQMYVVLRTSHDRSRAVEAGILALRGACMNALTLRGFLRGAEQRFSIRHTSKVHERLHQAAGVYGRMAVYAEEYQTVARRLAAVEVTVDSAQQVLEQSMRDRPKRQEAINAILGSWRTDETVGFEGTGWGLMNAVSGYFEHGRSTANVTAQSRFLGALQGETHRTVNRVAARLLTRS
jgi:phage/plasmid-like protein (TIGR03299 family)